MHRDIVLSPLAWIDCRAFLSQWAARRRDALLLLEREKQVTDVPS